MNLTVVHHIPGRIRWRSANCFTRSLAETIAEKLDAITGVEGVRVSPRCGSILITYSTEKGLLSAVDALAGIRTEAAPPRPASAQRGLAPKDPDYNWWPLERYVFVRPLLPTLWNTIHTAIGSIPFIGRGISELLKGKLNVEVLDASAVGISLLMRDFGTAGLVILLEFIVARSGAAIPVDGTVVSGEAFVNQSTMTGEPLPVRKAKGMPVFAGTVVEEGEVDIRPTGSVENSRLNQIARFIDESERQKSGIESRMDHLADAIVPFNFLLAGLVFLFTRNLTRTASVLLVDYSCALRLSTPLCVLSAMKEGTRENILVKGGRHLESLAEADVVVFDKTGTLTQATPRLTDVVSAGEWSEDELLKVAACLEEHFPHPVSHSIVKAAREAGLDHLIEAHDSEVKYVVAHGIRSRVEGRDIILGSRHFVEEDENVDVSVMTDDIIRLSDQGKSILYMAHAGKLIGIFGVEDPPKENAVDVIRELKGLGIKKVVMLTGDDPRTAANIAARLGIDEFRAQMLPESKAEAVKALRAAGYKVIMVGDGINDTPALTSSDVGVSLRDGTDIAQEVADVVLTANNLADLPKAIRLARSAMTRVQTNFKASVGLNTLFLAGGLTNVLTPAAGALLHNGTTIGVCVNSMRGNYLTGNAS